MHKAVFEYIIVPSSYIAFIELYLAIYDRHSRLYRAAARTLALSGISSCEVALKVPQRSRSHNSALNIFSFVSP